MKTLLLSVSLLIATYPGLGAKTVKFPEKDPAFSITLPDDWIVKTDRDGNLDCKAGDGSRLSFLIQRLDAKTEE
jgi:hypothetical protein